MIMANTNEIRRFLAWSYPVFKHFRMLDKVFPLLSAYTEAWRGYHNVRHVNYMADKFLALPECPLTTGENRFILLAMIAYHDAWLKVGRERGENERRSAQWAVDDLSAAGTPALITKGISQGIIATTTHDLSEVDIEYHGTVSLLFDLDLLGLSKPRKRFREDTEAIWLEFQPIKTRDEYDAGRVAWARVFLERDVIYHTAHFAPHEERARANLRRLAGL